MRINSEWLVTIRSSHRPDWTVLYSIIIIYILSVRNAFDLHYNGMSVKRERKGNMKVKVKVKAKEGLGWAK
jgi:hypothetical protein